MSDNTPHSISWSKVATRRFVLPSLTVMALLLGLSPSVSGSANWPGWRGDGSGVSDEKNLPLKWDAQTNVAWKTPLPGEGNSSPVVWGDRVWVTTSTQAGQKRSVVCLSATDGKILWQQEYDSVNPPPPTYSKSGYASSTCATDGQRVFAFFDSPGLVALTVGGKKLWEKPLGPFKNVYSMTSSPVLFRDMVIINCDHDAGAFIAAFDQATGEQRWRTPRPNGLSYSTPLLIDVAGEPQLITNAAVVTAYDPVTGKELWSCRGMCPVVAPSAVAGDGLVYAASGRNGPALGIDPAGRGDVTDTRTKWQVDTGGPYVITPIVYPCLILPGDDGDMRFIDPTGKIVLREKLRGHYTSSPVGAGDRLYWSTESGETYVVDVSRVKTSGPAIKVLAVNKLDERFLASPALAGGRIFLRGHRHLFCIAGGKDTGAVAGVNPLPETSYEELKKRYDDHTAPEGPDVAVRIEVAEALGKMHDPRAIKLLQDIALNDAHWDPSEAAAKTLGQHGAAALPAFQSLLADGRPYLRVIAAENMGRLKATQATDALIKAADLDERLTRIAAVKALGQIATTDATTAAPIIPVLVKALTDPDAAVRLGAIDALAQIADLAGKQRDVIVKGLSAAATDTNPQVAQKARSAMRDAYKLTPDPAGRDREPDAEGRRAPMVQQLTAGPISVKFQDGELRYLRVGQREIVRRIYFAVRDAAFDTVMPQFDKIEVQQQGKGFKIDLSAVCKSATADFSWTGQIVGREDGTLTFAVSGKVNENFDSPRVGLCVLYSPADLADVPFEAVTADGKTTRSRFPDLISNASLAEAYQSLQYRVDGLTVKSSLAAGFRGMEDQRKYGDGSYKAYSSMEMNYPKLVKGQKGTQEFTLAVTGTPTGKAAWPTDTHGEFKVKIDTAVPGAKMPTLTTSGATMNTDGMLSFEARNGDRQEGKQAIAWAYTPFAHMPDNDTLMENLPAILDQARTVRSFAPAATLKITMAGLDSPYSRPKPDARNQSLLAGAWATALVKYAALGGVEEVGFSAAPGFAQALRDDLNRWAGATVLAADIPFVGRPTVDVLAAEKDGVRTAWLINLTEQPQRVVLNTGKTEVNAVLSPFEVVRTPEWSARE